MKKLIIVLFCLFPVLYASAQTAADILEKATPVKPDGKFLLRFEDNELKYDAAFSLSDKNKTVNFLPLRDSTIFLVRDHGIRVYVRPVNPLNYLFKTETKTIIDPINEAAAKAMGSIIEAIKTTQGPTLAANDDASKNNALPVLTQKENYRNALMRKACEEKIETIQNDLTTINDSLKADQKEKINTLFEKLKKIDFLTYNKTNDILTSIHIDIKNIEDHFQRIETEIENAKGSIATYTCPDPSPFVAQYIFNKMLNDLTAIKDEQRKRLTNLNNAFTLVTTTRDDALAGNSDGTDWVIHLNPSIEVTDGKISLYSINLRQSGFTLNDKKEIVSTEPTDITMRTIRIRRFQRFVPEVSVGTVFTFFKYQTYGTTTDDTGQQYIAAPTDHGIHNLNIAAMINFNYYIQDSPLHPFYQLGAGINTGIPTLLTGFGLRSNITGLRRLAISGGIAMSWIKQLDKLKVGDKISGTDDIDKDMTYKFSWPPKPYIGLQYNL